MKARSIFPAFAILIPFCQSQKHDPAISINEGRVLKCEISHWYGKMLSRQKQVSFLTVPQRSHSFGNPHLSHKMVI
jgi:hypothetical protein